MAERILVTGATGKVGRELVRRLRAQGETVRAATRFPSSARETFGDDVEIVEMDYEATHTWDAALEWVDCLFLVPPPFDPHEDDTLGPFLDWAVSAGVGKVVLLSAMGVEAVPHLALNRLERHLAILGVPHVILRPNLYMQNLSSGFLRDGIRERDSLELCAGEGRVSFVDAGDVAGVAASALCSSVHDGSARTLTGPQAFALGDVARTLSDAAGRAIRYVDPGEAGMRARLEALHFGPRQIDVALGLFRSIREGRREPVTRDLAAILGHPPTTLASFVAEHASAWR